MNTHTIITFVATAQKQWRTYTYNERAAYLLQIADELDAQAENLAQIMVDEVRKPFAQGMAEVKKSAFCCRHFAEASENYLAVQTLDLPHTKALLVYEPMGVIFGIMPWNFPVWQVFRMVAPALMAGNAVIVKHAPNTTRSAQAIQTIFDTVFNKNKDTHKDTNEDKNAFLQAIFTNITIEIPEVEAVIAHPLIRMITLTGSERAGRSVAALAGKYLKKCILELGGSDALIVCESADLQTAAVAAITSRTNNNGQACNASKRFLVHRSVFDAFVEKCIKEIEKLAVLDKNNPNSNFKNAHLTYLVNSDITKNLYEQTQDALQHGAKILYQKGDFDMNTNAQPVLLLTDITPEMRLYAEEAFGTVATITPFSTDEEALNLANDTDFGLCAAVFTKKIPQADWFARNLEVGMVAINQAVSSDPRMPFGGSKNAGFGRELGAEGIRELCNLKTVVM
jgi:succinate-semialdehyde dehydrogenase / glutarate-semialdehyde dehydrogenase